MQMVSSEGLIFSEAQGGRALFLVSNIYPNIHMNLCVSVKDFSFLTCISHSYSMNLCF